MNTVNITVRNLGSAFACDAIVTQGRVRLYETRDYPHGQRANAFAAAEQWATAHGYAVVPIKEGR